MRALPAEHRNLILKYHEQDDRRNKDRRLELAARMALPMNALRIRVYRIRAKLEKCIENCLERAQAQ